MFFLNLTAFEFFGLLGVLSASITALYLLDRTRRKRIVSTLQFWDISGIAVQQRSRKRVSQPLSLLLQLVSLLLLLLALAQLQIGKRQAAGRNHVLMMDTSAWSNSRAAHGLVLTDEVRIAIQYIATLPQQDRVLVVGINALVTPISGFLIDREHTVSALKGLKPQLSGLDLPEAFRFAEHAQAGAAGPIGEVVYVGPAKISSAKDHITAPANLRILPIELAKDNVGIRAASASAVENAPGTWQANAKIMNYTDLHRVVRVSAGFAGTPFVARSLNLAPRQESELTYRFVTSTAGLLTIRLDTEDSLPEDNRVSLQLPETGALKVVAYSQRQDLLRPLLQSNSRLRVRFETPSQYASKPSADLVILDKFTPGQSPEVPSIWLDPPQMPRRLSAKAVLERAVITNWDNDAVTPSGLHTVEQEISHATIFQDSADYLPFARTVEGPTVVLGQAQPRSAVIGFDLLQPRLRYTVSTPLLFASLIQWVAPDSNLPLDVRAEQVGALAVALMPREAKADLKLTRQDGTALPFTMGEQSLQFFVDKPAIVRLKTGSHDQLLSLTLPSVAEATWKPPVNVPIGLPASGLMQRLPLDLWKWLAMLGGLGFLTEWYLFGRSRRSFARPGRTTTSAQDHVQPEPAMVSK